MNKILRVFNNKIHADEISSDFAQVFVQTSNNLYKNVILWNSSYSWLMIYIGVHKPSFWEQNLKT